MKNGSILLCALFLALLIFLSARPESFSSAREGAAASQLLIWVELDRKRLTVYENGAAISAFPIASGAGDTPSPIGVFRVVSRFLPDMSGFGTRFLGLNVPWGSYGIHGTNRPESIGRNASHGCVRLRVEDAEKLYVMIPTGTRVVMEGGPYGPLNWGWRILREGDRGADVMQLQIRLRQRGFLFSGADGVFGPATRQAVIAARKMLRLSPGDTADGALQRILGMILFE